MFTLSFRLGSYPKIAIIVVCLALSGPIIDWLIHSSSEKAHKRHLVDYICRVAEPRLQAGAFREVQDYLISSTRFFGNDLPIITLNEGRRSYSSGENSARKTDKFNCNFVGRRDVKIQFAFSSYRLSPGRFLISYIVGFSIISIAIVVLMNFVRSSQQFVADLFQEWMTRALELDALGISHPALKRKVPWITVSSELTDRINHQIKQLQSAIKSQSIELVEREADSAVVAMATQIAHDIRSPLSSLNIAISSLPDMPLSNRNLILNSIKRINDIANDLLKTRAELRAGLIISRNHTCKADFNEGSTINVVEAVKAILEEKRLQYAMKDVTFQADVSSNTIVYVQVSASDMKRVLSNLINNSVEAITKPGGKVTVAVREYPEHIQLCVSDNGSGVPSHIQSKIGHRGFSYGKELGSGLGLHHAKETAKKVGGSLKVVSREGWGTMVTLTFPNMKAITA